MSLIPWIGLTWLGGVFSIAVIQLVQYGQRLKELSALENFVVRPIMVLGSLIWPAVVIALALTRRLRLDDVRKGFWPLTWKLTLKVTSTIGSWRSSPAVRRTIRWRAKPLLPIRHRGDRQLNPDPLINSRESSDEPLRPD